MNGRALRPRSGSSAKALLLTILGEFVLPHAGSMWTSTVVGALGVLGVDERNARQAVGRLADQGIVESERAGRKARWHLTNHGRRLLTEGTTRIYEFGGQDDRWDGRWLVVLCSVPEDQRAKRHQLRSQLGFAGFGFLAPGVAVSPHLDREANAATVLNDLSLLPGAVMFRAEPADTSDAGELIRRAWDVDSLAEAYERFLGEFGRRSPRTDDARFAAVVDLVHEWRRFPFVDPEIPLPLLPRRWPGRRAKQLFDDRHRVWASAANAWYERTESSGGG